MYVPCEASVFRSMIRTAHASATQQCVGTTRSIRGIGATWRAHRGSSAVDSWCWAGAHMQRLKRKALRSRRPEHIRYMAVGVRGFSDVDGLGTVGAAPVVRARIRARLMTRTACVADVWSSLGGENEGSGRAIQISSQEESASARRNMSPRVRARAYVRVCLHASV